MLLRRAATILLSLLIGIVAFGCDSTSTIDNPPPASTNPTPFPGFTFPTLDLANGVIPIPNDLLRDPTTGRNNFPGADTSTAVAAMNAISGFSTAGNLLIPFTGTVVPASVTNDTLPVFNAATGARVTMVYTVTDGTSGSTVVATPILPLAPSTQYIVVITEGVTSALSNSPVLSDNVTRLTKRTSPLVDGSGGSLVTGVDDATAASLERVRLAYQPIWGGAEQLTGTGRESIPLAFAFTTQELFSVLTSLRTQAVNDNRPMTNPNGTFPIAAGQGTSVGPPPNVPVLFASLGLSAVPNSAIGSVFQAVISMPNYISDPATGSFANPPVNAGDRPVPALVFMPDATMFPGPRPVVIFQHGLTRSKNDAFALANAYNAQGLAVVAIDLVLHGDLRAGDVFNNTTNTPGADGVEDANGTGFLNTASLLTTRDNVRQSVVDLYYLTQAIASGQTDLNGDGVPELAPASAAPITFIGTSINVGVVFTSTEPNVRLEVANALGGRLSLLAVNSPTLSPQILASFASQGATPGTAAFGQALLILQTVLDDVDAFNYAPHLLPGDLAGGTPTAILLQENIGDNVVPNSATRDLANALAAGGGTPPFSQVNAVEPLPLVAQVNAPFQGSGMWQFTNSGHAAFLDPSAGPTSQIVGQLLTFIGAVLQGGQPTIINPATLAP